MTEHEPVLTFLDDDALHTPPIASREHPDGKVYRIESPDAETGLFLTTLTTYMAQRARNPESEPDPKVEARIEAYLEKRSGELPEGDLAADMEASGRLVLGDTVGEMIADGVSWVRIQRISKFAMLHFVQGPEAAAKAALSGLISGGAVATTQNRAERRAKAKAKGKRAGSR